VQQKIKNNSEATFTYLVGPTGIEPNKWRSPEWLKDVSLPPSYGIVSSNISKSVNSMYDDAGKSPWSHCLDNILNIVSTCMPTLREENKNKVGLLPDCVKVIGRIVQHLK
jgi:hypothetical protein